MRTSGLRIELEGWRARLAWELALQLKFDQRAADDRVERLMRELALVHDALAHERVAVTQSP